MDLSLQVARSRSVIAELGLGICLSSLISTGSCSGVSSIAFKPQSSGCFQMPSNSPILVQVLVQNDKR